MSSDSLDKERMALMLLKAIIFHYHGLDEEEEQILYRSAGELDAEKDWNGNSHYADAIEYAVAA